ncbi:CoA transferase [Nocardia sp. 348MFTsu5.1]|uniref:CoA transferase n=1 Tax=Nocardia sp. 348MFTsu5.1 TaxID=1172185 RepID=UPI0003A79997|nr:CoA transferase [Nocardia sp. 348MFTsu5.1]
MIDPAERWARSGMAHLTGDPDGPPDFSRAGILAMADEVAEPFDVRVDDLLAGRSTLMGTSRQGRISAGGATRLIRCSDTWAAFSLARTMDIDSLGALLSTDDIIDDPWSTLEVAARTWVADELVERAQMLEIPAAVLGSVTAPPVEITPCWERSRPRAVDNNLLVVDLSAMWAGPLCGQLLGTLGATVIKVESPGRPDGARAGNQDFFRWMNGAKLLFPAEITSHNTELADLLDVAEVVIEASRPRALESAGLDATTRAPRRGRVWVRITGYGTAPDMRNRVAFGDDAAVAGGLVGQGSGGPVFCGDAIADPLSGLEAARAVVDSLGRGGGELIDVVMSGVAAKYAAVQTVPSRSDHVAVAARMPPIAEPSGYPVDAQWVAELIESRRSAC